MKPFGDDALDFTIVVVEKFQQNFNNLRMASKIMKSRISHRQQYIEAISNTRFIALQSERILSKFSQEITHSHIAEVLVH